MAFILSKIFLFLLMPFVWAIALFILALSSKKPVRRKRFLVCGVVVLLFFSNGFIIGRIFNAYEAKYPKFQKYDVGIVLGGFAGINKRNNQVSFGFSGDRFLQAIALYKNGTINKILVTGGSANLLKDKNIKEADLVKDYLKKIGIPDSVVLIENQSRNTIENAKFSKELIHKINPKAKVLVITSAWHIPRAKLNFSKYFKNNIEYYPTNHIGKVEYDLSDFMVPSADALNNWNLIFKEWVGLVVDRFRN
ncbi:MAG: YdcF family protein [Pedobacter sp.]|nr:MAG: YdcF family protein [Pedobacter sp.]